MLVHQIDPVLLHLGPVKIHWYGLMYLIGFGLAWWLASLRLRRADAPLNAQQLGDLVFYCALGAVVGGRLGYVLFYNFPSYIDNPLAALRIWEGGMSFHGGMLGVILVAWLYGRHLNQPFFRVADFIAPLVPPGLGFGRIGNFINGELWGAPTDLPWGVVFPHAGGIARHPTQLYEAALEGLALFLILWLYSAKPRPMMAVSGVFLLWYGIFRFAVEFVRLPDAHIGYLWGNWLTMGQLLSLPMIVVGMVLLLLARRQPAP